MKINMLFSLLSQSWKYFYMVSVCKVFVYKSLIFHNRKQLQSHWNESQRAETERISILDPSNSFTVLSTIHLQWKIKLRKKTMKTPCIVCKDRSFNRKEGFFTFLVMVFGCIYIEETNYWTSFYQFACMKIINMMYFCPSKCKNYQPFPSSTKHLSEFAGISLDNSFSMEIFLWKFQLLDKTYISFTSNT